MSSPCQHIQDKIADYVLGVLSEPEIRALRDHLQDCPACREYMRALEEQNRLLVRLGEQVQADTASREDKVIEALNRSASTVSIEPISLWRSIMKSRIIKLTTAAVIIVAVLIGIHQFGSSVESVAWANVVKNVEQAKTVTFRLKTTITDMPDSEIMVYDSSEYGSRIDLYVDGKIASRIYAPKDKNESIMVIPQAKRYTRMSFTEEQREQMREREKDPREFVKLFMSVDHTKLPRKTVDGIEVEGLEVNSPKVGGGMFESAIGRLWADVKTHLPVRMEIEGISAGGKIQTKMVMDKFKWDEKLAAGEFEPNIPADYSLQAETKMPDVDEDTMIEGLRFFAELTGGRYPSSMASMTGQQEMREAWQQKYSRPPTNEELNKFHSLNAACNFHADLVQENKDVEYHGDKVTANDIDDELMRWKISDNEYRVIYGDLRVETVVDKNKLMDMALKISGKKLSTEERGLVSRIFNLNEQDVIKGLAVFLELSGGRYPTKLDTKTALTEIEALWRAKHGGVPLDKAEDKEKKKEGKKKVYDIFFASAFYDKLVREKKDVAYYGDKITVEDSGKVLMRWKISDDEYRAIFGDLTIKKIPAERLTDLEKPSLE